MALPAMNCDVDGFKVFYREAGHCRCAKAACCCTASRARAICSAT